MKRKIIVMILSLSLMLVGLTSVVGGVGNERRGFKETESEGSSNFEVVINTPEDGQVFQEDEKVNVEYVVENTGDVEDTQEIVSSVNGEKINVTEMTIGPEMSRIGHTEFNASYWAEQFEITEVRLDLIDSPDFVELGDYFEATGQGHYAYLFPETDEVALKEDHLEDYRFTIRNESDILVEVPAEEIELTSKDNYSTFEGSIPTEGLEKRDYTLQLEALEENMQYYESISKNLTLVESTSDHEERIISEGIDFLEMEKNPSREEFEIGLEYMEEEEALEIKVSSEDDEYSVNVIIEETEAQEIHNWHDLDEVRDDLDSDYVLMNDLDENTEGYDELIDTEEGWDPIGDSGNRFTGIFDGDGYEIKDLYIDRLETDNVGLFGYIVDGAEVTNLGVIDADVSGEDGAGVLAGVSTGGTIFDSYATGDVSGENRVGGLVGGNFRDATVQDSYAAVDIVGDLFVGGLVGENSGTVEKSYATGEVSGNNRVGGLIGDNYKTVSNSYATGSVSGDERVGGLVGDSSGTEARVENSYVTGEVSGNGKNIGGLVGLNRGRSRIDNSHYNIDEVLINNENVVTRGGLFEEQYNDWMDNDMSLDIEDYESTLVPSNGHYEIDSIQGIRHLLGFAGNSEYSFRLVEDLDMSEHPGLFIPYLEADFDGRDHVISDLELDIPFVSHVGMFGQVDQASVENIGMEDVDINGAAYVAGLAGGLAYNGTMENSYATGDVSGERYVGGLIGSKVGPVNNSYSTVDVSGNLSVGGLVGRNTGSVNNSYATGDVNGEGTNVGGLVGFNRGGTIFRSNATGDVSGENNVGGLIGSSEIGSVENTYATGEVSGHWGVGGLIGSNYYTVGHSYATAEVSGEERVGGLIGHNNGQVSKSYAEGEVTGDESVGGLIGSNTAGLVEQSYALGDIDGDRNVGGFVGSNTQPDATVRNSYALGEVTGEENVGGFVGENFIEAIVRNSYAVGEVTGEENVGGFVGENYGTVENSFWDTETSGIEESDGGIGLATEEMTGENPLNNMEGFDFEEVWETVEEDGEDVEEDGYPILVELDREDQLKAQDVYAEEDDRIPGFASVILLLAVVIAGVIYSKKKQMRESATK